MSKKRALLTSAVFSMAVLAASCGGGGGGAAQQQQPQPQPQPQPQQPTVGSLGTPAVFARLTPTGAGVDRYYFVDSSGNKVEVQGLAGKDITNVLYQFNNDNLLIRASNGAVYCVDAKTATAKDLGLIMTGDFYTAAGVPEENIRNRPFYIMNATSGGVSGGFVITKDCVAKNITPTTLTNLMQAVDITGAPVNAINNAYAIVRDAKNIFVVRADGTSETLVSNVNAPAIFVDNSAVRPAASNTAFVVGDAGDQNAVVFVDDKGQKVQLATHNLGAVANVRIQPAASGYNVVIDGIVANTLNGYRVTGTSSLYYSVDGAPTGPCPAGIAGIDAFNLDADGFLYVAVSVAAAGNCFNVAAGAANDRVIGVLTPTGLVHAGTQTSTPANAILALIPTDTGALIFEAASNNAYFVSRTASGVNNTLISDSTCDNPDGVLAGNKVKDLATEFAGAGARRIKNARTGTLLIGLTGAPGNNVTIARVEFASGQLQACKARGDNTAGAFAGIDRNVSNAFVTNNAGVLHHYTIENGRQQKNNVTNAHMAANCGIATANTAQIYGPTTRLCLNQAAPPVNTFQLRYVDYASDTVVDTNIGPAAGNVLFGDVSNKSPSLFTYYDTAVNRGVSSFCPSANTYEYLILGSGNVQYPGSGSQVGYCFKPLNSPNAAISLPLVKY